MAPTWRENEVQVLSARGAQVQIRTDDAEAIQVELWTDASGASADAGAGLVCQAVRQARAHHAARVDTALDTMGPTCGVVLEALRGQIGTVVRGLGLRRAGSSVMVTVELMPADEPTRRTVGQVGLEPTTDGL